ESDADLPVSAVLNRAGLVKNAAAARDLLGAGSVKVDGEVVDREFVFALGSEHICQAGKKKLAKIMLKASCRGGEWVYNSPPHRRGGRFNPVPEAVKKVLRKALTRGSDPVECASLTRQASSFRVDRQAVSRQQNRNKNA